MQQHAKDPVRIGGSRIGYGFVASGFQRRPYVGRYPLKREVWNRGQFDFALRTRLATGEQHRQQRQHPAGDGNGRTSSRMGYSSHEPRLPRMRIRGGSIEWRVRAHSPIRSAAIVSDRLGSRCEAYRASVCGCAARSAVR